MPRLFPKLLLPALALSLVASPAARATLIAYDGFDSYSIGGLQTNNGGTGWSTAWNAISGINVSSTAMSYSNGSVVVNGGSQAAQVDGATNSADAADRAFATQSGTLYFSFLFSTTAASLTAGDFVHFMLNNDTVNNNSGGIGKLTTSDFTLGARIGGSNGGDTTSSTTSMVGDTTYFLVGKISKVSLTNYSRMDLFINPTSDIEPTANATDAADSGIPSISDFSLRTFNLVAGDIYRFDELRIGTTFADVVPTQAPEPSSAALLCGGAAVFLGRRRRSTATA